MQYTNRWIKSKQETDSPKLSSPWTYGKSDYKASIEKGLFHYYSTSTDTTSSSTTNVFDLDNTLDGIGFSKISKNINITNTN